MVMGGYGKTMSKLEPNFGRLGDDIQAAMKKH